MMDLVPVRSLTSLMDVGGQAEEYAPMLRVIAEHRPTVTKALAQHGKSHTQFQYAMLDNAGPIAGPTKLRNMRQVLAVIDRTEAALEEAWFDMLEKKEEAEQLAKGVRQQKLWSQVARIRQAMAGAVRKLAAYYEQYRHLEQQVRTELGKSPDEPITEADFEADEERFHIMKAFEQALCAARANGGCIDHGNFIYFHDIGINGAIAQVKLLAYLQAEDEEMRKGGSPHSLHEFECRFLEQMAAVFKGCASHYAQRKGLLDRPSAVATLGCATRNEVLK